MISPSSKTALAVNQPEFVSRRRFLVGSAAMAVLASGARSFAAASSVAVPSAAVRFAYVGTYNSRTDGGGNGVGIYLFDYNAASGQLLNRRVASTTPNPTWMVLHPSRRFLYTINEIADFSTPAGQQDGSITAFRLDLASGALTLLNTVASAGIRPGHMNVDQSGRWALVANYEGGSFAVLPIHADGSLGQAVCVHKNTGPAGARLATSRPAGSFAVSGHERPHPHMIAATADNRFVLATDLGEDRIYRFQFNAETGQLTPTEEQPFVQLPSGDGPRHFAFHPNGRYFYCLQEEASTLAFFHLDPATAALRLIESVSTLPKGFAGTSFAAEIVLAADGRSLYCSNRLHDTISHFALAADGRPTLLGESSTMGDFPRHIALAPDGRHLFACNQKSDSLTSFGVQPTTGQLRFTGQYTAAGAPAQILFC